MLFVKETGTFFFAKDSWEWYTWCIALHFLITLISAAMSIILCDIRGTLNLNKCMALHGEKKSKVLYLEADNICNSSVSGIKEGFPDSCRGKLWGK